ncbi:MAG: TolC family protein [Desulfosporosinus sp.]|nr:TolC family protein [Desulfosporosinus sp.]
MPWSSGKITSKEEEIKADISGLSLERTDMEREMISQLNASLKKLESKREEVLLYDNQVLPLYKQAFDAQLTEYKNNQLSINTLLETLRSILLKEEAQAEVKMDYEMTLADIYMMAGTR